MNFSENFTQYKLPKLTRGVELPKFEIPADEVKKRNLNNNVDDFEFLYNLCLEGFSKKVGDINNPKFKQYTERLDKELKTFKELGFCGYALITWDIVRFCIEKNISVGYGRGSAAGSLVLYLVNITNIDPIKHNLYFERFLSKTRAKFKEENGIRYYDGSLLFDVDLDIAFADRYRVIEYLDGKYKNKTCKLLTVSTFSGKILVKGIVKSFLNLKEEDANYISNTIPKVFGKVYDFEEAYKESIEFKKWADSNVEAYEIGQKLENLNNHFGVHASAIVISPIDLHELIPCQLTKDKEIVSGYTMDDTLNLAVKVDLLGLRCASLISEVCKLVNIHPNDIDLNSDIIYNNIRDLKKPHGLFQIEAETNFKVLQKVRPRNLDDLSAIVALARPGALQFVEKYAKYVETGELQSIHPFLDDVFSSTGGLCLYQEQLMRAANKIGFTLEESEILRRIVGKKKLEEIAAWQDKIKNKIKENNIPEEVGNILWKIAEDSASYSFNASHSYSYASMCAATCYLKFKYPKEFFYVLLKLSKDEPNPIQEITQIQKELPFFNIRLLPPHILKSELDFSIEGDNIRMGLSAIKGVAEKAIEKLQKFKNKFSTKYQIFSGSIEAGVPASVISSLILTGSFDNDGLNISRPKLLLEYQLFKVLNDKERLAVLEHSDKYENDLVKIVRALNSDIKNNEGKQIIKDSRLETIRKKYKSFKEIYEYNIKNEELANYYFESNLIGYSYTTNLHKIYKKHMPDLLDIQTCLDEDEDQELTVIGEVVEVKEGKSKEKKTPWFKVFIKDHAAQMTCMAFTTDRSDTIGDIEDNNGRMPKEKDYVIIRGIKKGKDTLFMRNLSIQKVDIFSRVSELDRMKEKEES